MSLFGSSPDDATNAPDVGAGKRSSLFEDEARKSKPSGGLFNDGAQDDDSPWNITTAKRASRGDMVKTLLSASDVPESYVEAYDTLIASEHGAAGGHIRSSGVQTVIEGSRIAQSQQDSILRLVGKDAASIGRGEFNVLLALIGLAQEGDEVSLDAVDERRSNLPEASVPYINQLKTAKVSENLEQTSSQDTKAGAQGGMTTPSNSPGKSRRLRKDSLENLDADPWASPAISKNQTNPVRNQVTPSANAVTAVKPTRAGLGEDARTTSAFTTHSDVGASNGSAGDFNDQIGGNAETGEGWSSSGTGQGGLDTGGFGTARDGSGHPSGGGTVRSLGGGRTTTSGAEETITVTLLPEKEGMFMFQHHNYEVKSRRRGSAVVRRYSDFVWLLDCLHRRFPFRQLPLLPPKRVAVNGKHLSSDTSFIEKRRRGLVRFLNALVQHPVLSQEQLVVMFLTVPTELSVWRKQASISIQEEFAGKALPPDLDDSLPQNLTDTFDTVRSGVRQAADNYIGLCSLLERLAKRNQGIAADHQRFSQALISVTEASGNTYATDTNDVPLLNEGISSTAKHMSASYALLEDEARAWDEGVLEDFKKQRDHLVSVRDMFDRRDRYARDNIPQLERRIETNENKLRNLIAGAGGKPGEQEKLEQAVRNDKQSIIDQHARGVFIRECIRDELVYFQQSQYHISRMHQDWSQERVKYAELQADNWRRLSEEVEHMPEIKPMAVVVGMRPDNGSRVHPLFLPKDRRCIVQIYMCPAKSRADVDSYNIEQDPPRVKRQKSSSPYPKPTELDEPAVREEPWLNQLHIAARQGADDQQRHMVQPSPLQDEGKQRHGHRQMKVTAWEDGNAGIDSNEAGSTGSISNESYTKVNGSGDPIRSPPRKMLRIRSDGKLSSPKSCAVGEEEGVRRSRRSKGKVEPSWNGIVVIKYGKRKKTRLALGKKIEAILSAQRLSSDATEPSNGPKKPEEPPRPPHPFFTGQLHPAQESEMASKAKEKAKPSSKPVHPFFSNEPSKESRNSLCTPTTGPTNDRRDENSKVPKPPGPRELRVNSKPHGAGMSTKQPATFNLPPFGTDHARLMRVPGAREPMWPPHGMVHVGRECRQQISHGSSNTVTSDARKLKHIPVALSSQENVVKLTSEDRVGTAESLPTRHVMPGCKLQNAVLSRIFHSPSATAEDDKLDELSDQHIGEPSVPPYIQHLYLSIGRGRSAFDRFECESQDWVHKYAPKCAEDVLQQGPDAALIRDWLKSLTVSSVTVQPPDITSRKRRKIAKRKRRRQSDLDDFIEASDEDINDMIELGVCEDDELDDPFGLQRTVLQTGRPEQSKQGGRLGHAAVISGPHGCGKSAAVHAVAKELGFEIFEINAGARRSGRDIIDRVGDMAHNHLVQNDHRGEKDATVIEADENRHDEQLQEELTSGRQTTMGSFFKSKGYEKKKSPKKTKQPLQSAKPTHRSNEIKSQKQSLILLEEADVLFEEDKPFWTTIMELVEKSRRPIIMTCTDESLLPLENMLCYGIFRFTPPPKHVAVDSLVLIAANEGHLLERDAIECLYNAKRQDLRATIMELQYYCQLAIGDRKGGLDWMLLDPLPENVRDYPKTQLRVVSEGTYQRYLGWLGIDTSIDVRTGVIGSIGDIFQAAHNTWNLDTDDLIFDLASSSDTDRIGRGMSRREQLQAFEQFAEACSEADLLPCTELRDVKDDPLDHTKWKMPARFRANFVEGQRLLKGRLLEDLSGFTPSLALTLRALAIRTLHKDEAHLVQKVQNTIYQAIQSSPRKSTTIQPTQTEKLMDLAFNPLTSSTSGSQISSLDGPIATVATELAPYVRSIAASDVRLEEQRQQLSAALEQPGRAGGGKKRKTRASYAALEGGSKASTRRERWFPVEVNYRWVMRTGGVGWQDIVAAAAAEEEVVGGVEGREYDGKEDGEEGKGKVSGPSTQEYDSEDELMQ